MKEYVTYDRETVWDKQGKPATVRIDNRDNGRIIFSVEAVKSLGLKKDMRLAFRTYKDDQGIVYFYQQATGIPLREAYVAKSGISLAIFCRPLCISLLQGMGFKGEEPKTFDIKNETVNMPGTNCKAWFILKEQIHRPRKS